jgi:hypothetical protein
VGVWVFVLGIVFQAYNMSPGGFNRFFFLNASFSVFLHGNLEIARSET